MTSFLDQVNFPEMWSRVQTYLREDVLSWAMAVQVVVAAIAILLAFQAVRGLNAWLAHLEKQTSLPPEMRAELPQLAVFKRVIRSFLIFIFLWIDYGIAGHFHWAREGLHAAAFIALALTLVRLFTESMTNRFWARILASVVWLWAALYIFHAIEPWIHFLGHIQFNLDKVNISLLQISRALPGLLLFYWLSRNLSLIWRFWLTASSLT